MLMRVILVVVLVALTFAFPAKPERKLYRLQKRSEVNDYLVRRFLSYDNAREINPLETEHNIAALTTNQDLAKQLTIRFFTCCDDDLNGKLNGQELSKAFSQYDMNIITR